MKHLIHAYVAVALLSIFYPVTIKAQTFDKLKMDSLFDRLASKNKSMGNVTISRNGRILYSKAIGYSYITQGVKRPANTQTRYRIGSISKMFTATMILQLVEEGRLKLSTNLERFFPTLPNAKLITVSNLLNHRSGIHNFTSDADYLTYLDKPKTRQELFDIIARNAVDFQPDQRASYSNANYILLSWIIEDVTGESFAKALEQKICKRIDLKNTYVGNGVDTLNGESYSYRYVNGWEPETVTDMSIPGGAGAIISTSSDLCVFIESLFNGKLIADSNLLKMRTMVDGFGMGMFSYPFMNKRAFGHTGGIDGFSSMVVYFPEDSLAAAYCANGQAYSMNDVMIGALSIYYNRPYLLPEFRTLYVKPEDLDKYIGLYTCVQLPMKISITKDSVTLIAQASGQPSFRLEAFETDKFRYDLAGVRMEFIPERKEMILKQGGGVFLFTREK